MSNTNKMLKIFLIYLGYCPSDLDVSQPGHLFVSSDLVRIGIRQFYHLDYRNAQYGSSSLATYVEPPDHDSDHPIISPQNSEWGGTQDITTNNVATVRMVVVAKLA